MKIIDSGIPGEDGEIALYKLTAEYVQELDCCQSYEDVNESQQTLTLTTDDGGGGKFIRINTGPAGWSIDRIEDFVAVIEDFKNRLKCE